MINCNKNPLKSGFLYKIPGEGTIYVIGEDYFYKTESYYEIIEQENENIGMNVTPSSMESLEAYVVPICLKKAELYGIPVMDCKISIAYVQIPSIIYGINYYSDPSNYFIIRSERTAKEKIKHITHNGMYPFCYQKINVNSDIVECKSVFGNTGTSIPELRVLIKKIYALFRIPLMRIRFIKYDGVWRLSSLMPLRYSKLNKVERNILQRHVLKNQVPLIKQPHCPDWDETRNNQDSNSEMWPRRPERLTYTKKETAINSSHIGFFVDRQEISNSGRLDSLLKFRDVAEDMGYDVYFIFHVEIEKISKVGGLFIRSRTDPMNISFVASKMAEFYGIPVIDDPHSIQICSDKINMYYHLMNAKVPIPKTVFLKKSDINKRNIRKMFRELGTAIILKEPSTSFSRRVERVHTVEEFTKIAKRHLKLSDRIVAQEYVESLFDWRIGILKGEFLYGCKYIIPSETFKIQDSINGHIVYCAVESVPKEKIPDNVIKIAMDAANSIGNGLYGIDLKETKDKVYVIEVNDNPSLEAGELDYYPEAYKKIISTIMERQ